MDGWTPYSHIFSIAYPLPIHMFPITLPPFIQSYQKINRLRYLTQKLARSSEDLIRAKKIIITTKNIIDIIKYHLSCDKHILWRLVIP